MPHREYSFIKKLMTVSVNRNYPDYAQKIFEQFGSELLSKEEFESIKLAQLVSINKPIKSKSPSSSKSKKEKANISSNYEDQKVNKKPSFYKKIDSGKVCECCSNVVPRESPGFRYLANDYHVDCAIAKFGDFITKNNKHYDNWLSKLSQSAISKKLIESEPYDFSDNADEEFSIKL